MGRPTKVDGNPEHPASLGATDALAQASVLSLYDPDRAQTTNYRGRIKTWDSFLADLQPRMQAQRAGKGTGLRILTETVTSPTLRDQLQTLLGQLPQARWHVFDPIDQTNIHRGSALAFDRAATPIYDFTKADIVLSLDADFMAFGPGRIRYARDFASRRRPSPTGERPSMSRVYAVECSPTLTGAKADHRLSLSPREILRFAQVVAERLGVADVPLGDDVSDAVPANWLSALLDDLQNYRVSEEGSALVVAGLWQPPEVHALVCAINQQLGAVGKTVRYIEPVEVSPPTEQHSLEHLAADMQAGKVEMLFILGGNPVYTAPGGASFSEAMLKVPYRVHLGLYEDETSRLCDWHIPDLHYLETWGDIRAYDGTATIQQPLIAPLYDGRSVYEIVSVLLDKVGPKSYDIVRDYWKAQRGEGEDFDDAWHQWIHDGVIPNSAAQTIDVSVRAESALGSSFASIPPGSKEGILTLALRPDPSMHDGQLANNGWLQELPKPFTALTWDNAALISPSTAENLGITSGDVVVINTGRSALRMPIWTLPGQADNVVTAHLGFGRRQCGRVGTNVGVDVYPLQRAEADWLITGVTLEPTGATYPLASTQLHHLIDGRDLIRSGTEQDLVANPEHPPFMHSEHAGGEASLLPEVPYDGYKCGMSIDLTSCIGCNACVVACQAENNIPVVGKQQVAVGREMHWLRIDTYYAGEPANPETYFQPLPCMHCENAPCEVVCPVAATTHSPEGINEMTYNRCVGTRYCANNCPYKVRRFNFLHYNEPLQEFPSLRLLQNPDVTVRSRGVMEKCTFCVQRVNAARIEAEKDGRSIRDGEVTTACQSACPTQAIVFGDLNDTQSQVYRTQRSSLNYALLEELNTHPRTTYQAAIRNPNPQLADHLRSNTTHHG